MTVFDELIPDPLPPGVSVMYGTVTGSSPLRVQMDGDPGPLPMTPTTTVAVAVGDRVVLLRHGRQLVIVGVIGGGFLANPMPTPTAASGWSMTSFESWSFGPLVSWTALVERTGATITSSSTGNIGDTDLLTVSAAWVPVGSLARVETVFQTGVTSGGASLISSGLVQIRDANTDSTITAGQTVYITMPPYPYKAL